jgi:6-pyruvoyltetrahydropterin/6-carboxytetrahydropterin synthase
MLLDFTELKAALKSVCKKMDHTNLNDMEVFDQNPSAERIAKFIFDSILEMIPSLAKKNDDDAFLYAIDVFETDTNRARYIAD